MNTLGDVLKDYHAGYVAKREEAMPADVLEVLSDVQVLFRKVYNAKEDNVGKAEDASSLKQLSKGDAIRPIEIIGLSSELGGTEEFDEFRIFIPLVVGRKRWKYADSDSETGCWKLHRRFSGLNKCCTTEGYLSTQKVDEMFQTTCENMDAATDEYDISTGGSPSGGDTGSAPSGSPDGAVTVEFGYQTLRVRFVAILFFDGKYVRRRLTSDPVSVWRQDFYAKEQWCLSRYRHDALKAALTVCERLVGEYGAVWPAATSDLMRTLLLKALDDPKRSFDDLDAVVVELFADLAAALRLRSLDHYFMKGVNMLTDLPDEQLKRLCADFAALDGAESIAKLFSS